MNAHPYRDFVADRRHAATPAPVSIPAETQPEKPVSISAECGSGWYHDVAIQESQQASARKH